MLTKIKTLIMAKKSKKEKAVAPETLAIDAKIDKLKILIAKLEAKK
jgi:hypothetical protein